MKRDFKVPVTYSTTENFNWSFIFRSLFLSFSIIRWSWLGFDWVYHCKSIIFKLIIWILNAQLSSLNLCNYINYVDCKFETSNYNSPGSVIIIVEQFLRCRLFILCHRRHKYLESQRLKVQMSVWDVIMDVHRGYAKK